VSRPARFLALLLIALPLTYLTPFAKDKDPQLPPSPAAKATTVGEFALKVVRLAEDDPAKKAVLTAEEAIARLEKAGLHLGKPDDPLTDKHKSDFALAVSQGLLEKVSPPPVGFEACGALPKVPDCHACCLALPGASNQACGRSCGRAHADQQHASPSEPTP
jgi:hypothetical protein